MKIKKENDFFKVELPKTPLTKEDLVNLQKTLSIYIESNQKYFDENYETIDFDDVNSLRFGYHHNGKEDFLQGLLFLNIRAYKLYRIGEVHLVYDFVYESKELLDYNKNKDYPDYGLKGYDDDKNYVSSVHIEQPNRAYLLREEVSNAYLRSHLSDEIMEELLDMSNLDIRINGDKINVYDFLDTTEITTYAVALSSDT